jgi:hypothetical protein
LQIFLPLAGKPRRGPVALEVLEVAAAAADRGGGCLGRLGHIARRRRLLQVWPFLFLEIGRERQHVVLLEGRGDWLHQGVLARAALEVA